MRYRQRRVVDDEESAPDTALPEAETSFKGTAISSADRAKILNNWGISNKKELLNFLDQQHTNYADVAFVLPDEQVKQENTEALNVEVDKVSKQRYNSADVRKLFNHAANIVKEFENPAVGGEKCALPADGGGIGYRRRCQAGRKLYEGTERVACAIDRETLGRGEHEGFQGVVWRLRRLSA